MMGERGGGLRSNEILNIRERKRGSETVRGRAGERDGTAEVEDLRPLNNQACSHTRSLFGHTPQILNKDKLSTIPGVSPKEQSCRSDGVCVWTPLKSPCPVSLVLVCTHPSASASDGARVCERVCVCVSPYLLCVSGWYMKLYLSVGCPLAILAVCK